jgi:peptide/nickel transport system permease protein
VFAYVLKRMGWSVVVLWAVVTITFGATYLSPIDPAIAYSGPHATHAQIARTRAQLGLDQPLYVRYGRYLDRIVHGDFGTSFAFGEPVRTAIFARLPRTGLLALAAVLVQVFIGVPLGVLAALGRGTLVDRGILAFSLLGVATPSFVLGFLFLYFFAFRLNWFPLGGSGSISHLVLPASTIGLAGAAWYARMLRSTTLNVIGEDFVKMARAKGLPERLVVSRHVLRNSLTPIIAMAGLDLGILFGGVLVIEQVFAYPGIGQQAWTAIQTNDVPMVMGTVLVAAFFITILNLFADLLNAWLDPRVKLA